MKCFGAKPLQEIAHEFDVGDPVLPRRRKVPRRYKIEIGEGSHPEEVEDYIL